MTKRIVLWAPVVCYMAFIFYGSSLSDLPPALNEAPDKLEHAVEYFGLGVLLMRALAGGLFRPATTRAALLAVVIAGLYGASDEFHQHFVPLRQMDVYDLLADTVGAAAAAGTLYAWGIISARNGV